MASFQKYKTKQGEMWLFKMYVGIDPRTGKPKPTTRRGFKTKKEAQRAAAELQKEVDEGKYSNQKDILFKDFVHEWLTSYEAKRKVKPGTIRVRKHEINNLLPFFSHIKLVDITPRNYQKALNTLKSNGYADNTLDGIHATGKMIFTYAMELELINKDPTQFAYVPKTQKTVEELEAETEIPKYMEKEELTLFLNIALEKGLEMDYDIFLTFAYTGLRAGELCAIKETDVNFEEHTLSITKTYYNPNNNIQQYTLVTPKTQKSKRIIKIDPLVTESLKRVVVRNKKLKLFYGKEYHDKGFIFVDHLKYPGYPIYIKKIENRMNRLLKISGLNEKLTPHSLRHTHTSLLSEAGVSLERIMERLGHSDDRTTTQIYLHTTKAVKVNDAQQFSDLMRNVMNLK
jgi:integrase